MSQIVDGQRGRASSVIDIIVSRNEYYQQETDRLVTSVGKVERGFKTLGRRWYNIIYYIVINALYTWYSEFICNYILVCYSRSAHLAQY